MRESFASLLFGWVAKSRANGQINGYTGCLTQLDRTRLIGSLFLFSSFKKVALFALLLLTPLFAKVIDSVEFTQQTITSDKTLKRVLSLNENVHYSDSLHDHFIERFERSNLFDSVSIDTLSHTDSSVIAQFTLKEKNQLYVSSIGGGLYGNRYGEDVFPWIRVDVGVSKRNLRGTGQKLTVYGSLFRVRRIGTLWDIPLSNDFFLQAGALIGSNPSIYDSWHLRTQIKSLVGFGKTFRQRHSAKFNISPTYMEYEDIETTRFDSFGELISSVQWKSDFRDRTLNPRKGFYFKQNIRSNAMKPYRDNSGETIKYITGTTDLRTFISPWAKDFTFAIQAKANLTYNGSLNRYNKLYMGGSETIRGFNSGHFGGESIFNNILSGVMEFRFPIYSVKSLNLSFLSWYDESLKSFPFDIAGALFINGGYLWEDLSEVFDKNNRYYSATGAGGGIRVHLPTLNMSVCGDVGIPIHGNNDSSSPTIHGYINLPF